eukprot:2185903-Ditylum_brightwellii.AAC.1
MASNMILTVHLDASYLSESNTKSRAAGIFYLANRNDEEFNNGAILTLSTIIQYVVTSASEAELAALFYNAREAVHLRVTLKEIGHKQLSTAIITGNNTTHGLTIGTMIPKQSKTVDMQFYWLKCQEAQKQLNIEWKKGEVNKADYHSKHHAPRMHQGHRQQYVMNAAVNENLVEGIKK